MFGMSQKSFMDNIVKDAIVAVVSGNKLEEVDHLAAVCCMTKRELVKVSEPVPQQFEGHAI